jgi:transaldolase
MNPLKALESLGQSVWLDDIHRSWLRDGTFSRWVSEDGVSGVTSNPAIFAKAIRETRDYEEAIVAGARERLSADQLFERLAISDVQAAADLLRPTFAANQGADGFVSLEVSPHLADDTPGTIAAARRLWKDFDRPNAMIKVPGTRAGLPAIRTLISDGININITLLFGLDRYREVVDAWMSGLEDRLRDGKPVADIASVASFFLSRIDTLVDKRLDTLGGANAADLRSRAAIASARLAYTIFEQWIGSPRWQRLRSQGVRPQRLLWASTSTKDPRLPDTYYVEALIAPQTVNTLPRATIDAYRDHGSPAVRIREDVEGARRTIEALRDTGIDLRNVADQLERDGVKKFVEPFDELKAMLTERIAAARSQRSERDASD